MRLGRWIQITRPVFAYPFADLVLSWPLDLNRAVQRRRSPRGSPLARSISLSHGRGMGRASLSHLRADSTGLCSALNAHRASSPGSRRSNCSRRPQSFPGDLSTRGGFAVALPLLGYLSTRACFLGFFCTPPSSSQHPRSLLEPKSLKPSLPPLPHL